MLGLIALAVLLRAVIAAPVVQTQHGLLHERQLPEGDACGRLKGLTGGESLCRDRDMLMIASFISPHHLRLSRDHSGPPVDQGQYHVGRQGTLRD